MEDAFPKRQPLKLHGRKPNKVAELFPFLVIAGPPGVGKSQLVRTLLETHSNVWVLPKIHSREVASEKERYSGLGSRYVPFDEHVEQVFTKPSYQTMIVEPCVAHPEWEPWSGRYDVPVPDEEALIGHSDKFIASIEVEEIEEICLDALGKKRVVVVDLYPIDAYRWALDFPKSRVIQLVCSNGVLAKRLSERWPLTQAWDQARFLQAMTEVLPIVRGARCTYNETWEQFDTTLGIAINEAVKIRERELAWERISRSHANPLN